MAPQAEMPHGELSHHVGVKDFCPRGTCCPWVREGRGLDALGKFFHRRRRRRRRRPRQLLLDNFSNNVHILIISYKAKVPLMDIAYFNIVVPTI